MTVAARLAGFMAVLLGVFGLATLAGGAVDPPKRGIATCQLEPRMDAMAEPMGVASEQNGYRIVPVDTTLAAGSERILRFRIVDTNGRAVRGFCDEHGARLHLIIVSRDLSDYHHLHPRLASDGTWSIPVRLREPGGYRAFADFKTKRASAVLGTDIFAPGELRPRPLPHASRMQRVDGYTVRMDGDRARAGGTTDLHFSVWRDGREVKDLQPYLGARGHLVALREGDLAYLHVHPEPGLADGAAKFWVAAPSTGTFRMFLDFQVDGVVHTAAFTVVVS
ncbi:MAG: hypothetical protein ACJ77Z_14045 [Thermoleophilaceae bacterium]